MQLPSTMPAAPRFSESSSQFAAQADGETRGRQDGIEPAGCCGEVCTPLGCTCLVHHPLC
jgi:hypothetical protein